MLLKSCGNIEFFFLQYQSRMKRTLTLLILFSCFFCCNTAFASKKVLVVLGSNGLVYRTAYNGLIPSLAAGPATDTKTIVISRNTHRVVIRYKPDVIIAIGNNALIKLYDIKKTPVGYLLCTNLRRVRTKGNFFGISTDYDKCALKTIVKNHMPGVNTLARLQSPDKNLTGHKPADLLCQSDITYKPVIVRSSSELPGAMLNNAKSADAVVIDPDLEMLTPETKEYLFQFSLENQIPLISLKGKKMFSESAIILDLDPIANGRAMADMANRYLLTGEKALERVDNRWFLVLINKRTVKMLKLDVKTEM